MDSSLVSRLRRGETSAFDEVYAAHHARLYTFVLRLSGRRDVADDLFQETFTKLALHAGTLREDSDLAAWLFTVARNAYRSHRRWALLDLSRLARDEHAMASLASDQPSPEGATAQRRELAELERALGTLSDAAREALLLTAVEGFDQEQAAHIVGISYAAFRQRLSRARSELAAALAKRASA